MTARQLIVTTCFAALVGLLLGVRAGGAVERNFAGSAQLDYHLVPTRPGARVGTTALDGFTSEVALKVAADISERLSANAKVCHGCHGFELPMAYFDYRLADELNFRAGRFSPSFGAFNLRHDPANHALSSKPLPYDMGRMLRRRDWNLGVLPSPFPDNGLEVGGTHWFGERAQADYAIYAVAGFRAQQDALDLEWAQSLSSVLLVDNNSRPSVGSRAALTFLVGSASDLTIGGSAMYGTYDPANRLVYSILGGDISARFSRTHIRAEYLVRLQTFEVSPEAMLREPALEPGTERFDKHGAYLEVEFPVAGAVDLIVRSDGLYRTGNVHVDSPLSLESAVLRQTAGAIVTFERGFRLKTSVELWSFYDEVPGPAQNDVGIHTALVGTF